MSVENSVSHTHQYSGIGGPGLEPLEERAERQGAGARSSAQHGDVVECLHREDGHECQESYDWHRDNCVDDRVEEWA